MEFSKLHNFKIENNFNKLLLLEDRDAYIKVIEKLTRTKIVIKDNNQVFIIW